MGLWTDQVVPRLVDVALSDRVAGPYRERVAEGLTGTVLELGFGSGRNLPFYPAAVTAVLAVEPSEVAWAASAERRRDFASRGARVERIGLDGAKLEIPDASVDAAVSTWTLCTIPDLPGALAELRRVLRHGGLLHFVEHELSPTPHVAALQRFLQPAWGRMAGGCHMDRRIVAAIHDAGFTVDLRHDPRFTLGVATPSS